MEKTETQEANPEEHSDAHKAVVFLSSMRGQYIIGQALAIAIDQLESVSPEHMRELSNISDMKFLAESIFTIGYASHMATKQFNNQRRKEQND